MRLALAFVFFLVPALSAAAAELWMFTRKGCPYCQRWETEIGAVYPKTCEAARAPLKRVDVETDTTLGVALAPPPHYTPTFVLVDNSKELGRILGYANEEAFWGMLNFLLDKHAVVAAPASASQGGKPASCGPIG